MKKWNKFKNFIKEYINIHLLELRYNEKRKKAYYCLENPLHHWWKCRKYFKFPSMKFQFFYRKDHSHPWFRSDSKILTFIIEDLIWKTKFGMYRHEESPKIYLSLFKRFGFYITFGKSYKNEFGEIKDGDLEYWEYVLNYNDQKSLKTYSGWTSESKLYKYWDYNSKEYKQYRIVVPTVEMSLNKKGIKQLKKELKIE